MSFVDWLCRRILGDISVPKKVIIDRLEQMDTDSDGDITLVELVIWLKRYYDEHSD